MVLLGDTNYAWALPVLVLNLWCEMCSGHLWSHRGCSWIIADQTLQMWVEGTQTQWEALLSALVCVSAPGILINRDMLVLWAFQCAAPSCDKIDLLGMIPCTTYESHRLCAAPAFRKISLSEMSKNKVVSRQLIEDWMSKMRSCLNVNTVHLFPLLSWMPSCLSFRSCSRNPPGLLFTDTCHGAVVAVFLMRRWDLNLLLSGMSTLEVKPQDN